MRIKLTRRRVYTAGLLLILAVAAGWFILWNNTVERRFARSKPALEAYAAQVMATGPEKSILPVPRRLGAFETNGAERLPHGFLFFCDYGNPFDANGIAYSTEPLPKILDGDYFDHIEGNWYMLWRSGSKDDSHP